jgi:hypothetical protein
MRAGREPYRAWDSAPPRNHALDHQLDTVCDRKISGASTDASGPADQRRPGLEPDGCVVPSEQALRLLEGMDTDQGNLGSAYDSHASRGGQIRRQRATWTPRVYRGRTVESRCDPDGQLWCSPSTLGADDHWPPSGTAVARTRTKMPQNTVGRKLSLDNRTSNGCGSVGPPPRHFLGSFGWTARRSASRAKEVAASGGHRNHVEVTY